MLMELGTTSGSSHSYLGFLCSFLLFIVLLISCNSSLNLKEKNQYVKSRYFMYTVYNKGYSLELKLLGFS